MSFVSFFSTKIDFNQFVVPSYGVRKCYILHYCEDKLYS